MPPLGSCRCVARTRFRDVTADFWPAGGGNGAARPRAPGCPFGATASRSAGPPPRAALLFLASDVASEGALPRRSCRRAPQLEERAISAVSMPVAAACSLGSVTSCASGKPPPAPGAGAHRALAHVYVASPSPARARSRGACHRVLATSSPLRARTRVKGRKMQRNFGSPGGRTCSKRPANWADSGGRPPGSHPGGRGFESP